MCFNMQTVLSGQQTRRLREQEAEQKRIVARRAYQQWLANKKSDQKQRAKQQKIEEELTMLQHEQKEAEKVRAQDSFTTWKRRKDLEMKLKQCEDMVDGGGDEIVRVEPSPTLSGGYCSVWACDEQLADHLQAKVHREYQQQITNYH